MLTRGMFKVAVVVGCMCFSACGIEPEGEESRSKPGSNSQSQNQNPDGTNPENPEDNTPLPTAGLYGEFVKVSSLGLIEGWAINVDNLKDTVEVVIEIDGAAVATVKANSTGFDGGKDGDHRFTFEVPENFKTGDAFDLSGSVKLSGDEKEITKGPKNFNAYDISEEGSDFYTASVRPQMNACVGCHPGEVTYDNHFELMLDPPPAKGGTATNNRLILKASGGLNHGGGNRCGGINAGACAQIQTWWATEFE